MPTIIKNVSARNEDGVLVRFEAGDELPEWAVPLITNPSVLAETPAPPQREDTPPTQPSDSQTPPAAPKPSRQEIVAKAVALGIPGKGKSEDLLAAISAKEAEQSPPADSPTDSEPSGDGANTRASLEEKAKALGVDFTAETSDAELELAITSADTQE